MCNQRLLRKTKKTAIDKAAEAKKAEIDQTPDATDEEKAAAKAKVDEAVNNAKASIDQATNNNGVDTAKSEGSDAINHVQPVVVKKDAKQRLIKPRKLRKQKSIKRLMRQTKKR